MTLFADIVPRPGGPIDWRRIEDAFDWFRRLEACPQDPVFHAEGDVKVHTRLVCEALVADPRWRRLDADGRASLFWAALLHDVAKPDCTRVEPNGRVVAPGHSRRGQIATRQLLWRMEVPFAQREQICHLITHHQVPFHLLERQRPERLVHTISLQTRCDLLSILAHADAAGRECPDRERLFDNVALFEQMCVDEACHDGARAFPSAHSRFLYFRNEERAATYEAYDDWQGRATLMSGLPASGKDTWLKQTWLAAHADDAEVVSLDDLREEMDVDPGEPQGEVVAAARERALVALRARRPVVWNATNISRSMRARLVDLFAAYRAKIAIVYLEAGAAEAERRNRAREQPVPARALARMLERWEPPDLTECHDLTVQIT